MSDVQDSILPHNFVQQIPKSISNKILNTQDILKDGKVQGGGKFQGKQDQGNNIKGNGKLVIVSDNDKNHSSWRAKSGKDFTKVFYKNQRQCPRTHDGKPICMKFFIRGFCDKSCSTKVPAPSNLFPKKITNKSSQTRDGQRNHQSGFEDSKIKQCGKLEFPHSPNLR